MCSTCLAFVQAGAKGSAIGGAHGCPPKTLVLHNVTLETLLQHIEEGAPLTTDELACVSAGMEANGARCAHRAPHRVARRAPRRAARRAEHRAA